MKNGKRKQISFHCSSASDADLMGKEMGVYFLLREYSIIIYS